MLLFNIHNLCISTAVVNLLLCRAFYNEKTQFVNKLE